MKLAVFTKNLSNPAYAAARLGAERAGRLSAGVVLEHFVPPTPDDPVQQSALIDQALAWGADAFVFTPVHPNKVDAAIARITAAGRPIFGFVNRMAPGLCVSYCGSSDDALARDITGHLVRHLAGRGAIAIVEGPADSITSQERVAAFDAVLARHPGLQVVARCDGRYLQVPARDAFAALLPGLPQLDAVLAANDIMAIGVLDALQAAHRRAAVLGVNAIPQAIDAIRRGEMLATADFNAMQMCFTATECALRHLQGQPVPAAIELPVAIVTAANAAAWDLPYEDRVLRTLEELSPCFAAN